MSPLRHREGEWFAQGFTALARGVVKSDAQLCLSPLPALCRGSASFLGHWTPTASDEASHFSLNNVFKCIRQTYKIVKETNILKWSYQDILKNQMYNINLRASLLMHKITRSSASLITSATLKQTGRKRYFQDLCTPCNVLWKLWDATQQQSPR